MSLLRKLEHARSALDARSADPWKRMLQRDLPAHGTSISTVALVDLLRKVKYSNRLMVRGCGSLWTVEREMDEVLVFPYGSLPVFTRTHRAAKYLAEYCQYPEPGEGSYPPPRGVASGLRWIVSTPD